MFVYVILALTVAGLALLEVGKLRPVVNKYIQIGLFLFLLVVGLRYMHGDYGTYQMGYETGTDVGGDIGYYQLQLLFWELGFSFQSFVFLLTLLSVFAFKQTFRLSLWPCFGLVMILGKIFTLYAMSGIRQYIAIAIAWWAISELLINRRKYVFFLLIFVAYTLHGSALIILPVYFFRNRAFNMKIAVLMMIGAIIVGRSYMSFFAGAAEYSDFVNDRLGSYIRETDTGGASMNYLNFIENFLFLIFALKVRKKVIDKIPYYDFFLYMFLIYCGLLIAGSEIGIIKRLRDYYALSYAIIVPASVYIFKERSIRKLAHAVFIAYFIFLMFRSLFVYDAPFSPDDYGRMIPYHSIFEMKAF